MDTESNRPPTAIIVGGTIVVLIILFFIFCFRIVGVGQVGIITRLGNVNREYPSGVVVKLPFPIEHLVKMDVRTQKEQQDATAATKDLQTVTATLALNYHLTPDTARKVYQTVGTDYKLRIIDPILQDSIKATTSQFDAADLIGQRSKVETSLEDRLNSKLADRGISVDNVSIVNFQFSEAFDNSIEAKQVAQQNAQKAAYDLQTAQQRAQAQDVQAKTLTPEYLQLQAIEKWDGKMPNYVSTNSGSVFSIPVTNGQ